MERDFSPARLESLLTDPRMVLRHDVDVSLDAAAKMARLEHDLGLTSTFYVMRESPFYTVGEALRFCTLAGELGHRLGAHVDLRASSIESLAWLYPDIPVSAHCPRPEDLWLACTGFEYAYDPCWKRRYYADSRGRFAHGDPEDHPVPETLQLNLHSEWWFDPLWYVDVDDDLYQAFFHEPKSLLD